MDFLIDTLNQTAEAWWPYVVHATWQAAVIGPFVLGIVGIARRWPSPVRYWFLVLALGKFAVPPLVALPVGLFGQIDTSGAADATGGNGPVAVAEDSGLADNTSPMSPAAPLAGESSGFAISQEPSVASRPTGPLIGTPFAWSEEPAAIGGASADVKTDGAHTARSSVSGPLGTGSSTTCLSATSAATPFGARLGLRTWLMLVHVAGSVAVFVWVVVQYVRLGCEIRERKTGQVQYWRNGYWRNGYS